MTEEKIMTLKLPENKLWVNQKGVPFSVNTAHIFYACGHVEFGPWFTGRLDWSSEVNYDWMPFLSPTFGDLNPRLTAQVARAQPKAMAAP